MAAWGGGRHKPQTNADIYSTPHASAHLRPRRALPLSCSQVERFRDSELAAMRLEEALKFRSQMAAERQELDRMHADRLSKLRSREEEMVDKLRRQQVSVCVFWGVHEAWVGGGERIAFLGGGDGGQATAVLGGLDGI
eukprot:364580-Chlamydomonas_euryale.AAC.5